MISLTLGLASSISDWSETLAIPFRLEVADDGADLVILAHQDGDVRVLDSRAR